MDASEDADKKTQDSLPRMHKRGGKMPSLPLNTQGTYSHRPANPALRDETPLLRCFPFLGFFFFFPPSFADEMLNAEEDREDEPEQFDPWKEETVGTAEAPDKSRIGALGVVVVRLFG